MRTLILTLLALFVSAPAVVASENDPAERRSSDVVPSIVEQPAPATESRVQLKEVKLEKRAAPDDAVAAQLPQRGSFWWLVGVIVVAGVILAVLL